MEPFNWDRLAAHLQLCHGGLMRVWNLYRNAMHQRGFETQDALGEVAKRCLQSKDDFVGTTVNEFCRWSQQILLHWIYNELSRKRPGQFPTSFEAGDSGQLRPSQDYQDVIRRLTYLTAREGLTNTEFALVAARYENPISVNNGRPRMPNAQEVREHLQQHSADVWAVHPPGWADDDALFSACAAAWERLNELAKKLDLENRRTPPNE